MLKQNKNLRHFKSLSIKSNVQLMFAATFFCFKCYMSVLLRLLKKIVVQIYNMRINRRF